MGPADLPIARITLFEDRGEVLRSASLSLPKGPTQVKIEGLSPLIVDRLVSAWFEPPQGVAAHVEDIHIERRWVDVEAEDPAEDTPARLKGLAAQIKAAEQDLETARQRYTRALQQRKATAALLNRYTGQVGRALWTDQGDPEQWSAAVDRLTEALKSADARLHTCREAQWHAEESLEQLRDLVDGRRQTEQVMVADVTLQVTGDGGEIPLKLSAVTPCALWRPAHEAHLEEGDEGPRIAWQIFATVWQRTGEDWSDVELVLSTARPGAGARLPDLSEDRLYLRAKTPEEQRTISVTHRTEAISRDDAGATVPGVDDGGEIRVLRPSGPVSIPSDGRPHRVAVGQFTEAAELDLVVRPEASTHVYLRASMHNPMSTPLLAGPVTLLRDGAYVGTGDLLYIGGGEAFELSFGSDDRFVVRHRRRRRVEDRMLGRDRTHFVHEVELASTGEGPETVHLALRMPVSELKQVKVVPSSQYCSEGDPRPDVDGLVILPVTLHPGRAKELSLGFHFETQGSVHLPDPW
ncbi:MAG: mucoidy inhibitor MuiA family protein [Bradymonadia bacterium]